MNESVNDKRNVCPAERQIETAKKFVCSFSNLLLAEMRCHRTVGYKNSVARFDMLLLTRCFELYLKLKDNSYKTQKGEEFEIFEPKYRIVTSTKFVDRIPQSSFVTNYIYPKVVPTHIKNNCACVKTKGVEYARNIFKNILRHANINDYCLKVDFKDYFGSINHNILIHEMKKYIKDSWAISYFSDVINSNNKEVGIGLGSEINQLSAVTFLNFLDHTAESVSYERYMDDLLFVGTKQMCKDVLFIIEVEALRLGVNISKKKTYIQPINKPIKFLGFTFLLHPTGKITFKRLQDKLNNEKRKLRRMKNKNIPFERILEHYQSVRSNMKKGTRSGVVKLDKYFNNLFKEEITNVNKKREFSSRS